MIDHKVEKRGLLDAYRSLTLIGVLVVAVVGYYAASLFGYVNPLRQVAAAAANGPIAPSALLFSLPTGFYMESKDVDASGNGVFYGPTDPSANWAVGQWGNPGPDAPGFSIISTTGNTTVYHTQNGALEARVEKVGTNVIWNDLSHDGGILPCDVTGTTNNPDEYDLFGGTNERALIPGITTYPGAQLSRLSALQIGTAVQITNIWNDASMGRCPVNQRGVLLAVIFNNYGDATHPSQTMFYQVPMYATRCSVGDNNAVCNKQSALAGQGYFYFDGAGDQAYKDATGKVIHQNFGYDDHLSMFGTPNIVPSQLTALSINILPRMKHIFASGPNGLDPDPSHWHVVAMYYGSNIWGNVGISTRWSPVIVSNGPVPILAITTSSSSIAYNTGASVSWSAAMVSSCAVSGPGLQATSTTGSQWIGPLTSTATYTLACQSSAGPQTKSITINVTPPASCVLDVTAVAHGASRIFYSARSVKSPTACTSVAQARICTNGVLSGSSTYQYATCMKDIAPIGYLEGLVPSGTSPTLYGWSFDPDASSTSIQVHIYVDGPATAANNFANFAAGVSANASRNDVDTYFKITGQHGFSWQIPAKFRGTPHTFYVYGINTDSSGGNPQLTQSPMTIKVPVQ